MSISAICVAVTCNMSSVDSESCLARAETWPQGAAHALSRLRALAAADATPDVLVTRELSTGFIDDYSHVPSP